MIESLRNRLIVFGIVLVLAVVFLLPTLFKGQFTNWVSKPILLGLDLSGGVHLVYEVQTEEAVKSRLQATANGMKAELTREKVAARRPKVNDQNEIEVQLISNRSLEKAKSVLSENFAGVSFLREKQSGNRSVLFYGISDVEANAIGRESVGQAVENLRNRVDQFGVSEPIIQKVGERRILLQMPGVSDIESVKKVVGKVAKLEFRFLPRPGERDVITIKDRAGVPVKVEGYASMTGDAIDTARVEIVDGQVQVSLTFTTEGGRQFGKITGENVGRNMAIILDGVMYSSPTINERISGGRAQISGGFTLQEAKELATVLRAGALPAPLHVLEERTVGPTLGKESIRRGVIAILLGFAMITLFMVVYYGKSGAVAVGTLAINVVLVVAMLSAFGATLTLPGLAGLALTIGMAVDANVIIFERIREEIRVGATRDAAVRAGFDKAFSAIIDSNLTTLLTGVILYYFGTGPIRGFAVTLSIGVLTTIYCATFVARLGFDFFPLTSKKGLSV